MKPTIFLLFLLLVACSQPDDDYFPLGEGIQWEYQITKQSGKNRTIGKSIIAQLPGIQSENIRYFPYRYANGEILYYSSNETGLLRSPRVDQNGQLFLKMPFALNASWKREIRIKLLNSRHESFSGGESFISQGEKIISDNKIVGFDETITVPAGVFPNTMRIDSSASVAVIERTHGIDQIMIEQTEWYAKGVGLIKRSRKEFSVPEKYRASQVTELINVEHY